MVAVTWGVATSEGLVRRLNEDAYLVSPRVFAVADGMGGHNAGDVASQIAIEQLRSLSSGPVTSPEAVRMALQSTNERLLREAERDGAKSGMGTTVSGIALAAEEPAGWFVFNVGDSRVYRCSSGLPEQLTVDHSYVQELVDAGRISAEAARIHPDRNVVTRALGSDPAPEVDIRVLAPRADDWFVVCTDGLTSELDDAEIAAAVADQVAASSDPALVASRLVEAALGSGGRDNVTVVVVHAQAGDSGAAGASVAGAEGDDTAPRTVVPIGVLEAPRGSRETAGLITDVPGPQGDER